MEKIYLTVKDEEGILRPFAGLWKGGEEQKYAQPEIDKFLAQNQECKLVTIKLVEVK